MPKEVCLCIHGHFYQPPRENPWLEAVELQESARPYHDWNEKINRECYLPNAMARVLDEKGRIVDIVNNYEKISFNFGPTLFPWLAAKAPEVYQHILSADRKSRTQQAGHGNAIAQIYNHMIMPLANRRDKITQVKWGLEDFRFRFGREPESLWLPETACNEETLEVLIEEGIQFIILSPYQAEAVRPLKGKDWTDVSSGTIDPKVPYRCFLKGSDPFREKKFIDIFFYDGPVSKEAGFGSLAFEAKLFADRLTAAKVESGGPQLISVATDGETYGHHKAYGERALAYLLNLEAGKKGFRLVNYAEFLELCPPQSAVRLKEGENGEGTSWSCVHGVKRWKGNCGCRQAGPEEWTQEWRKPLRETFDWLRDSLAAIYEREGKVYLKDVWEARDDYARVLLDRSPENIGRYFERHASRALSREEITRCLKLLESQRHALLMYSSCGWFFSELSGIETVQVIQYAARAVHLNQEATGVPLEEEWIKRLAEAKSNIAAFKDGRGVYEKLVKPRIYSAEHLVSYHAIFSILNEPYPEKEDFKIYGFKLHILTQRREVFGDLTLNYGRLRISSDIALEEKDLIFIAVHLGLFDFRCSIKPFSDQADFENMEKEFFAELPSIHFVELLRKIDSFFGPTYYDLKDLPVQERTEIISFLTKEIIEKISAIYENLYDENRRMNEIYRAIRLPIPREIRYAVEHTLSRRLGTAVKQLARQGFNLKKAGPVTHVLEAVKSFGVEIDKEGVTQFLSGELERRTRVLRQIADPEAVTECLNIQKLAKRIGVGLPLEPSQENLFFLLKQWIENPQAIPEGVQASLPSWIQLVTDLHLSPDSFKKAVHKVSVPGSRS